MPRTSKNKKFKLTTRISQIEAQLAKAKEELAKPEGSRNYVMAVGHLRLAQSLTRRVKDFIVNRECSEIRQGL